MKPDNSSPGGDAPVSQPSRDGAAEVIRTQISALYGDRPATTRDGQEVPATQPAAATPTQSTETPVDTNPYHRTHASHVSPQAEQWKEYHSAWQNYYQQYYAQFYAHQTSQQKASSDYFAQQLAEPVVVTQEDNEPLTRETAIQQLRQRLLGRVSESAQKVRRSRHFVPIVAALAVILIFVFLQYNRTIFASVSAYVSPGSISPQNIVVDPTGDTAVTQESRLIIPKINVDVPAIYDVGSDYDSQMKAMEKGVAHFAIPGANSHPGEVGNTVLSGHSSNDLFDPGDYKFIFAQLEKLKVGDTIYANYKGVRYTYVITKTEVVKPTQVSKLVYPTKKPMLTLITCTPLGTALNRLLVTAEQITPDPAKASDAPAGSGEGGDDASIPGNSPSFFERLFGIR